MSFKRPKTIKIGTFNYKVVYHRACVSPSGDLGTSDTNKKRIDIWKHESTQALRDTVLHEVTHVLLEDVVSTISKMKCDDSEKEEVVVRLLTPRFLQLILDNPGFVDWLRS